MVDTGFLPQEQYAEIFSKVPRLCVDFLIEYEGKYVLTRREEVPHLGMWHIPGGRVQFRETLMDALVRISKKEFGYTITPKKMLGYIEMTQEQDRNTHSVSIVFLCNVSDPHFSEDKLTDNMCLVNSAPSDTIAEHAAFLKGYIG